MKQAFVLFFSIMVVLIKASIASCLRSEMPEVHNELMEDVWQSLPQKMKDSLCHQNIRIRQKKILTTKDAVGLAIKPFKIIYLKEEILIRSLNSDKDYLVAKRNIIHELAHFYFWKHRPEKQELTIHSGRTRNGFIFKINRRRNYFDEASLDHYEFKNEEEFFAVNTELFLTQADYQCRRPLQYEYFQKIYHASPFPDKQCKRTKMVPVTVNGDLRFKEFDYNRLYQMHFLLADRGKDISSRFGHAMLRLVFCSKKRISLSEDCLQDVESHYVLSFRANVTDAKINYFSGLTGSYDSQMHVLPYKDVIDEYAGIEKRPLYSFEVNATSFSVGRLEQLVLDQAWSYRGKYKFLSNNCGTELLSFLQLLIPEKDVFKLRSLTPKNLVKNLQRSGIFRGQSKPTEVILPRSSEAELYFIKIQSFLGQIELKEFLLLRPTERLALLDHVPRTKANGAILIQLQNQIFSTKQRLLWNSFVATIEKDHQHYAQLFDQFPKVFVPKGIPLTDEVESIKRELSRGLNPELIAAIKLMFPDESATLDQEFLILETIRKTFFLKEEK